MLIDNISSYRTLISDEIVTRSLNISNRSLIGDRYIDICELHLFLSIIGFSEINSDDKEEVLSYIVNRYNIKKVGLPILNFLNIAL